MRNAFGALLGTNHVGLNVPRSGSLQKRLFISSNLKNVDNTRPGTTRVTNTTYVITRMSTSHVRAQCRRK